MNQTILAILVLFGLVVGIYTIFYFIQKSDDSTGVVIVLNGPSGSGKSSIQREFQTLMMPKLWVKLGIDNLFDKPMPDITHENLTFWQSTNPIRWVTTTKDINDKVLVTLFTGEEGEKVAYGMNNAIVGYAQAGCHCIIDYIAYKKTWINDLRTRLTGIKTYWIKIELPLDVLEEREQARATSPVGHGRSHYDTVYADMKYDLVLDTSKLTPIECAQKIKALISAC